MRAALNGARALLLATVLVPLLLPSGFFFPYVSTRNIFFRACVLAAFGLFVAGAQRRRHLIPRGDRTFGWFCLCVLAMCVSAIFGAAPWRSLFGEFERMGGVIAWTALLLFYFLLRTLMTEGWRVWFARGVLLVADVSVIFCSNGSMPDTVGAFVKATGSGAMIGNPGLLGAYLLLCLIFAGYLLINERRGWRAFAGVSAAILLVGIAFSLNRSSQLGLVAGIGVAAGTFFALSNRKQLLAGIYGAGAAGLGIVALAATSILRRKSPALSSDLFDKWIRFAQSPVDESRIVEWKIAVKGFLDRPLLGYGPDNYSVIRSIHFDPAAYAASGFQQFDRPHNGWLELLATGGMLGLIAMLGIWGSAIVSLRTGARSRALRPSETALFAGALAAYAVYLTFWFFDLNSVMLFVALLALLGAKVYGTNTSPAVAQGFPLPKWISVGAAGGAVLAALYFACVVPLRAASDLGTAVDPSGSVSARLGGFQRAFASGAPQAERGLEYYDLYLGQLVSQFNETPAPAEQRDELRQALGNATHYATRMVARDPFDDHSYAELGTIEKFSGEFTHDPGLFAAAERNLRHAVAMSPKRAETRSVLANFYLASGDTLAAIAQLDTASRIAPIFSVFQQRLANSLRLRQGIHKRL